MGACIGQGRQDNVAWADAPVCNIRGKWHGYRMTLDLRDWMDRATFFLGRFYELGVQLLVRRALRPGDRFVDVGANTGMLTLLAARLVGETGRVNAFEPNAECCRRIRQQLVDNRIRHVRLRRAALSDEAGSAELKIVPDHSGFSTLGPVSDRDRATYSESETVPMMRGDEALGDDDAPVSMVKIDVEGFECRVLRGMARTLERDRPRMITEVNPYCLRRAGADEDELFTLMHRLGYRGEAIGVHETRWRRQLTLTPIDCPDPQRVTDVLWTHHGRPHLLRSYP